MIRKGQVYRHFKGYLMTIIEVATHTETGEEFVIYEHNGKVWARPKDMFLSLVDKEKYPECKQKYRFELVNDR